MWRIDWFLRKNNFHEIKLSNCQPLRSFEKSNFAFRHVSNVTDSVRVTKKISFSLPTRRNTLLIQCWQLQHCPLTPRAWRKKNKAKGGGKRNYREKTKMSKQRRNEHDAASNSFPETFKSKSEAASAILTCRESCQPTSCAHSHCTSSRPATAAGSR